MVRWSSALAVLALARAAAAAPAPKAHLLYVRGPGAQRCPDEQAVREVVARRLGYDPFAEREAMTI